MASRIKHIGIMSQNAPRLFKFYECLFDLRKAASEASPSLEAEHARSFGYPVLASKRVASPFDRTIIASDGNIGVAFNRRRPGYAGGLDHFGIQVDELDGTFARIKEKYPSVGVVKRPSNRPFADYSTHDPEGNIFDLMQPGKSNAKGVWLDGDRENQRWIKHVTIRAMNPEALAKFYIDVYEFKEEEKALEDPNFYLTDGKVTFVIAPWKIQDYYGTEHKGPGMDHIGFKVENLAAFKNDVEILSKADPEWLAPKSPNLESEYNVVLGLMQACRYGRHQLPDPEGNFIDVSE
ncbi:MAG TPA: VOC family protein [Candidatus Binatia bacterium]|jgi:predicted enzyme related to lactoylglutathione lyase